jgi:hypothetical protein
MFLNSREKQSFGRTDISGVTAGTRILINNVKLNFLGNSVFVREKRFDPKTIDKY